MPRLPTSATEAESFLDATGPAGKRALTRSKGPRQSRLSSVLTFFSAPLRLRGEMNRSQLRTRYSVLGTHTRSIGLPVRRSMRLGIGGWVENRLAKSMPISGCTINKCAVEGVAIMGMRLE